MVNMKKLFAVLLITICAIVAQAQSGHSVALTWTASPDAAANPTLSYNVYRATTACNSPSLNLVKVGSVAAGSLAFSDSAVSVGNSYCYAVTSLLNGLESVNSNTVQAVILPSPPTITVKVQ